MEARCDDPALVNDALAALGAEVEDDGFLTSPITSAMSARIDDIGRGAEPTEADILASQPRQVGAFTLVRLLGEGGMGRVFLATQSEPMERQVALKLLKWTFSTPEDEARFDAERQALARLSHPNIVQLYEAGTTPDGRPWFAMELTEGEPVTLFCNRHHLDLEQRLRIFQDICAAVEHAHRRQILHRDIKPSNVLVTLRGGEPRVTMIDFGVAKGLDRPLTDATLLIDARTLGTPAYASPEALEHDEEVDTRSDVYSLGVLLYQLICGVRPMDDEGITIGEFIRRIIEEPAPRPSERYAGLDPDLRASVAQSRATRPGSLQRTLRGDLDWITLKAIDKSPSGRYNSASGLAEDIQRYLDRKPTLARPPTLGYLARRYARRHAVPAAAAALVILALTTGLLARTLEARRAQAALAESQELSGFLVDIFFTLLVIDVMSWPWFLGLTAMFLISIGHTTWFIQHDPVRPPRLLRAGRELAYDVGLGVEAYIGVLDDPAGLAEHRRANECHRRRYVCMTHRFDVLDARVAQSIHTCLEQRAGDLA